MFGAGVAVFEDVAGVAEVIVCVRVEEVWCARCVSIMLLCCISVCLFEFCILVRAFEFVEFFFGDFCEFVVR